MRLDRLYKRSKTGKVVYTDIYVDGDTITVETGQTGTDKPIFHKTICKPKNIGRANATSSDTQAIIEAKAKHVKKQKERYVLDPSGDSEHKLAMKIKEYKDQAKNVVFPCYVSPKLDGGNGLALRNEAVSVITRGGDPFPTLEFMGEIIPVPGEDSAALRYVMSDEIEMLMDALGVNSINGELYIHGVHLQDIQAATKKKNNMTGSLEFHVFDYCGTEDKFSDRSKKMSMIEDMSFVKMVRSEIVDSHEEIEEYHGKCIKDGYEGIVIRNPDGLYEYNVRSSDVFKYKVALDSEYMITGVSVDKNGEAVFTMQNQEGVPFRCKPKGDRAYRRFLADGGDDHIGTWWTVKYEKLSKVTDSGGGVPLKPVGLHPRECDKNGNVLD